MDRQTEITTPGALLNEKGDLARPGFSRALVQEYRRADVKVSPLRIKGLLSRQQRQIRSRAHRGG